MGNVIDLTGQKFDKWTVIREAGRNKSGGATWLCKCECGTVRVLDGRSLREHTSKSCGCLVKDPSYEHCKPNLKHGGRNERLYSVWSGMIDRCCNQNSKHYAQYGGRGINVCDEWRYDYAAFRTWAFANGYDPEAPKYVCTIDRIDNDQGYSPDNCAWHNQMEQCNNRSNNHVLTFNGESHTISEWARKIGLRKDTLRRRIEKYGWTIEKALTTPNTHTA